ncbi:MAG: STAS domain-containing protein [Solirubrobacteraceae bacterium]
MNLGGHLGEGYATASPELGMALLGHLSGARFNILFPATGGAMSKETMKGARAVISAESPDWPGALIVARGELDVQSVAELKARLTEALDAGNTRVVVDLADVSFIDSLSLSALVGARRRLGDAGRLAVVAVHEYVRLILQATGLEQVLDVFETREAAVAFVRA